MSKIEVDTIAPQSGTTLTIGESGDTVTIPTGATFDASNATTTLPATVVTTTGSQTLTNKSIDASQLTDNTVTSAKINYPLTTFSSTGIDDNASSTAITIDSSERVGIGTTSVSTNLQVTKASSGASGVLSATTVSLFENSGNTDIVIGAGNTSKSRIGFGDNGDAFNGRIDYDHSDSSMRFGTGGNAERMRIDSAGSVLLGGTDTDPAVNGSERIALRSFGRISCNVGGSDVIRVGRTDTDGNLINFYQQGTQEGSISVSGTTVSYNGFTGTHWSRFQDNSTPNILRGTVLESLDEMCDWYNLHFDITTTTQDEDGNDVTETQKRKVPHVLADGQSVGDIITYNHEGTDVQATIVKEGDIKHMKAKVSDTVDAKNVYGVFIDYDNDGEGYNDFYVASVGSFVVRIKANETIAKGDLLQSNGDGTAKVQTDDAVRSSSFAKVLSTTVIETYEDGSFIVPCSLMC